MKPLYKREKFDIGLVPKALNNTNATGRYFRMDMWRKALFLLLGGAMVATKTTKIEILQAQDADGTGAEAITGAEATITANTAVTAATLTVANVQADDVVTVNGVVFKAAAQENLASHIFSVGTDDTTCAASLVKAINAAEIGVVASSALGVVTLVTYGDSLITIKDASATITAATLEAQAFVEVDVGSLNRAEGFEYLAAKVTTTANTVVSVALVRGDGRFEPIQTVGAGESV